MGNETRIVHIKFRKFRSFSAHRHYLREKLKHKLLEISELELYIKLRVQFTESEPFYEKWEEACKNLSYSLSSHK